VTERLGLGPDDCLKRNPRIIYAHDGMGTRKGPLALAAGQRHQLHRAVGPLHSFGRAGDAPVPPLNLVGDFGGGALYLALGVVAGCSKRKNPAKAQVVDAAMVDGSGVADDRDLRQSHGSGFWNNERGDNITRYRRALLRSLRNQRQEVTSAIGSIVEAKFYADCLKSQG